MRLWRKLGPVRWAIGLAFAVQFFEYWGWLASPEGILLDFFLGKVRFARPVKPATIVTLEIDDDAFKQCFVYSPMDPKNIRSLVTAVAEPGKEKRPRVIGVDIITDSQQQDDLAGYMDLEELEKRSSGKPPVVWAAGVEKSSLEEGESFIEWFTGGESIGSFSGELIAVQPTAVLGKDRTAIPVVEQDHQATAVPGSDHQPGDALHWWGLPVYPREDDLHLRRFPRVSIVPPGEAQFNWASQLANLYNCPDWTPQWRQPCIDSKSSELFISLAGPVKILRYKNLFDLFDCPSAGGRHNVTIMPNNSKLWEQFGNDVNGSIVLIGGTFRSARDTYPTPIGPLDGLLFNAYAVQAELSSTGVSEIRPWVRCVLDIALGFTMAFTFHTSLIRSRRLNVRMLLSPIAPLVALAVSGVLLHMYRFVWLSWVGVAVGMTLHLLIHIWNENLDLPHEDPSHTPGFTPQRRRPLRLRARPGRFPPRYRS